MKRFLAGMMCSSAPSALSEMKFKSPAGCQRVFTRSLSGLGGRKRIEEASNMPPDLVETVGLLHEIGLAELE